MGLLENRQIESVCEVGCGEGFFLHALLRRFPHWKAKGSDLNAAAIAYARTLAPEACFEVENIYALTDAANSYDLVIASEVLEHLEDPDAALAEIARVSCRYLLLTVPHEPWFQITNFFRGKYLQTWGNHPEHIQRWSRAGFARFASAQCRVLAVQTSFPWTIVLAEKQAGGEDDASS